MVAVAISASSMNGYAAVMAAFDTHAHGPHGLHSHPSHDHGVGDHADPHDKLAHGDTCDTLGCEDEAPASSEQPCAHVHAHCCSAFAVSAGDCTLKLAHDARAAILVEDSHIPHGQLAVPLFRPPRAIA